MLDGVTKGPRQFSGSIGKMLESCQNMPIVKFNCVSSDNLPILSENVVKDLSCDQKYLYDISHMIKTGTINQSLKMRAPGALIHSRFLTTANRILRHYVSQEKPSKNLVTLVNFIIKVYAPMWFSIKSRENVRMGPIHLFNYIKSVRENFDQKIQSIIFKVVKNNSYFAHPENILLTMLTDSNKDIRERAVNSIIAARNSEMQGVRIFVKPEHTLNLNALNYYDMTNITSVVPPIALICSNNRLRECINTDDNWINDMIKGLTVHTQAVERYIKLVSSVSTEVAGEKKRNQRILSTIASRAALPTPHSKKDFAKYMEK